MQKHIKNYLNHFKLGIDDTWFCEACMKEFKINNGLEIHHIVFRSHGGSDDISNCISLCVKHHNMIHNEKIKDDELIYIHRAFMTGLRKVFLT